VASFAEMLFDEPPGRGNPSLDLFLITRARDVAGSAGQPLCGLSIMWSL
jgi:hypothetical protein